MSSTARIPEFAVSHIVRLMALEIDLMKSELEQTRDHLDSESKRVRSAEARIAELEAEVAALKVPDHSGAAADMVQPDHIAEPSKLVQPAPGPFPVGARVRIKPEYAAIMLPPYCATITGAKKDGGIYPVQDQDYSNCYWREEWIELDPNPQPLVERIPLSECPPFAETIQMPDAPSANQVSTPAELVDDAPPWELPLPETPEGWLARIVEAPGEFERDDFHIWHRSNAPMFGHYIAHYSGGSWIEVFPSPVSYEGMETFPITPSIRAALDRVKVREESNG